MTPSVFTRDRGGPVTQFPVATVASLVSDDAAGAVYRLRTPEDLSDPLGIGG